MANHVKLPFANDSQILSAELTLLKCIKAFNDSAINEAEEFIINANLSSLARYYEANLKKRDVDIGLNLFVIISDLYYRENFHSDILRRLIDPKGRHQEEEKYLHLFLEFINSLGVAINLSDYSNVQVEREKGRVDLLIKDEASKKAIIIENKINNAGDQMRQLPRYLDYVINSGYTCDAIIYLRLNGQVGPDMTGWSPKEIKQVNALLKVICAYDETENDLLNGWILKCKDVSNNPDAQHILRQYGDLIKKLGGNIMNKPIMDKFYDVVTKSDNLKTAISIKAMLDDLVLYRVERIIDKFKNDLSPFSKINIHANADAYFTGLIWKDAHFGLDVWVFSESYSMDFWDRNDPEGIKGRARSILQIMGCLDEYSFENGRFKRKESIAFPSEEEKLFKHITNFKRELGETLNRSSLAL